jgi:lipopolysaccharide export system protein LptA
MNGLSVGIAFGGIALGVALAFFGGRQSVFRSIEYRRDQRSLTWYNQTFLRKQGVTTLYGDDKTPYTYCLWSMDGGKTWYEVDEKGDKFRIIREADPKLVETITAWGNLADYVFKHGPLTLTGERAAEELRLLQGSGLTVKVDGEEVSTPDQLPAPIR